MYDKNIEVIPHTMLIWPGNPLDIKPLYPLLGHPTHDVDLAWANPYLPRVLHAENESGAVVPAAAPVLIQWADLRHRATAIQGKPSLKK